MKIKQLFTLSIVFILFSPPAYTQNNISEPYNIKDYFLLIPENILNISLKERKEILKKKTFREILEAGDYYQLDTLDLKNGYIEFQTVGDGEGNMFEMTYYKLDNDERIIALNIIGWGMCCEDSKLRFYKIKSKEWIEITQSVLPIISLSAFYIEDKITESAKSELFLRYYLPQKGKNIKVKLADTFFEYMNERDHKKLFYAERIEEIRLIWNNGTFIKKQ